MTHRDILHSIGAAPPTNETDLYVQSRGFPLVYDPAEDPDVREEERLQRSEASDEINGNNNPDTPLLVDESEVSDDGDDEAPSLEGTSVRTMGKHRNVVQKVSEYVHTLRVFSISFLAS